MNHHRHHSFGREDSNHRKLPQTGDDSQDATDSIDYTGLNRYKVQVRQSNAIHAVYDSLSSTKALAKLYKICLYLVWKSGSLD